MTNFVGKKVYVPSFEEYSWSYQRNRPVTKSGTILEAPPGSKLLYTNTTQDVQRHYFIPDVSGIYTLTRGALGSSPESIADSVAKILSGEREVTQYQIAVAEQLTRQIGTKVTINASGKSYVHMDTTDGSALVIYIEDGKVIATTAEQTKDATPALLDHRSSKASNAAADKAVIAAVAALIGKTAHELKTTYLPALIAARNAALASPTPKPQGVDSGAAELVADGWSKQ